MKLKIEKLNIEDNIFQEVTSSMVFPNSIKTLTNAKGEYKFDELGIFSDTIFPKIADKLAEKLPSGYINIDFVDIPRISLTNKDKLFHDLLHYKGFLYNGKYVELDMRKDELLHYDQNKVLCGKDACIELFGISDEEYKENVQNKIYVSHPSRRPIIKNPDGTVVLSKINQCYIDILRIKERYEKHLSSCIEDFWYEFIAKKKLIENVFQIYEQIIDKIQKGKNSNIQLELKGHPIDGMCRAVITNNFSLDEDVVLIGSYFIPFLYPHLYRKHTSRGYLAINALNRELRKEKYYCLLNRMPTIGAGSTIGMIPQFSALEKDKYVFQLNPIVMEELAGDFDGDSLSVVALYSREACAEAEKLLASKNYLTNIDGSIINGIFEDLMYSLERMVERGETNSIERIVNSV